MTTSLNPFYVPGTPRVTVEHDLRQAYISFRSSCSKDEIFTVLSGISARLQRTGITFSQSLKFSCDNRVLATFPEVQESVKALQMIIDTCLRYSGHGKISLLPYAMYSALCQGTGASVPIPNFDLIWSRLYPFVGGVPSTVVPDDELVAHLIVNALPHYHPNVSEISLEDIQQVVFSVIDHKFFKGLITDDSLSNLFRSLAQSMIDDSGDKELSPSPGEPSSVSRLSRFKQKLSRLTAKSH